ncbi:chorismate mutase [Breznakia blatticola]|uniref:Bifunctional chorismate mutase/prephenate dehydratase n=1 Tax=Breznakia blatticola TaxID=1754012 RepID=A0A4R7ZCW1_9FIRM|nr:chorismate mutase [Breznakia blatticola]TDW14706.1 chorismate mutase [Breznakia blatticola]
MNKLEQARVKINEIDQAMAELFEKRMHAVEDVISYKQEHQMEVLDFSREQQVIQKNLLHIQDEKLRSYYEEFITDVMKVSRHYQHATLIEKKIGYQGTYGAFSYLAARATFPDDELIRFKSFEDVCKAVESKEIRYGVIPLENSHSGEVGEVSDLLYRYPLYIVDIFDLQVNQALLAKEDIPIDQITKIYSHPQAISQCSKFLKGRNIEIIEFPNTALAAEFVSKQEDPTIAAIASKEAAQLFGLKIVEDNIQTNDDNTTRFAIVAKEANTQGNHFQVIFTLANKQGTLAQAINSIASRGFNMKSIKSRSIPQNAWSYYFQVELEGFYEDASTQAMLKELGTVCRDLKYIGSYNK